MNMYRQGDVLLIEVDTASHKSPQRRDARRRVVLAYGEATGHAHAIHEPRAKLYGTDLENRFLEVLNEGGVTLSHEEHAPIHLPQGTYRVVRQREWTPKGQRWVAD